MTNHTPEALISSISGDYYLGNDAELELAKNIVAQLAAVTAQRDELLAALKIVTTGTVGDILDRLHEFHSLVAKCEVK